MRKKRSTAWLARRATLEALALTVLTGACRQDVAEPGRRLRPLTTISRSAAPADRGMGSFDNLARQLAFALQHEKMRMTLLRQLRDTVNRGTGIDLRACDQPGAIHELLVEGERRGGLGASALCADLRQRAGVVLYMDPGQLNRWNPSNIPIVTALLDPTAPLPPEYFGYRSPDALVNIGADRNLRAPVLVIAPLVRTVGRAPQANSAGMPSLSIHKGQRATPPSPQ